ncbi:arginyl-tRNA synthetase, class Ic [Artemisia annua]|uniref:arginine--tRNA ligase n=1 Tax=Artemisia annua TaxID=35608 RepID=A0A2U1QES4_ARTAN|nr:arginyl-tRNA synthetase, class Ic [Artemisia annua]
MKASTPTNSRQLVIENESRKLDSFLRPLENMALQSLPHEHTRQEIAKPILLSTPTMPHSTSTTMSLTTQIPEEFEWIRVSSTYEEREKFRKWLYSTEEHRKDPVEWERWLDYSLFLYTPIVDVPDPEEDDRFLDWELSTSPREAPDELKRLKWTHRTATADDTSPDERNRWSLQEEILKPLETALEHIQSYIKLCALKHSDPGDGDSYPDLKQEHTVYTFKGKHGLCECRNAFWIWTKLKNCPGIPLKVIRKGPVFVGEKIKALYLESDMIKETPSINELGVVTIKLSGKWIAKCIHKMLKDGIETWAPKLPVKKVILDYPSLDEEIPVDLFRRCSIRYTLMSILEYSKVDATTGHCSILPTFSEKRWDGMFAQGVLDRWFPYEEIEGYVLIKGKVPFILPKRDFENAYKDIFALWNGIYKQEADWIIYLTPVRQQVYIEMCFAAAKREEWMIPSDRRKPPRTSYAGYRACTTVLDDNLLDKVRTRCVAVEQGDAAKLLGYTAEVVLDCVFRYRSLTNHRLAVCTFDIEMLNEEGNTFLYLLNTRAEIRRITDYYHKDISELKALELILEKDEGWEEGEELMLGLHLLEFTEALEESCFSVLPHILCEYLYDLAKKFNHYHSCVYKDGSVAASSTLLLYEATSVVMEKCFHLLGIAPRSSLFALSMTQLPSRLLSSAVERPIDANAR